jgi:hypothetical protein
MRLGRLEEGGAGVLLAVWGFGGVSESDASESEYVTRAMMRCRRRYRRKE